MTDKAGMLEPPWLVPVPIPTRTRWQRFVSRFATRFFCLGKDWYYIAADGTPCVIPGAYRDDGTLKEFYFTTDGKSFPRPARVFFSSLGKGLTEGLAHDSTYRYRCQIEANGAIRRHPMSRRECDTELRQIGIMVNGMPFDSAVAYRVLRLFGIFAWRKHRANDGTPVNDISLIMREFRPRDGLSEKPVKIPFSTDSKTQ